MGRNTENTKRKLSFIESAEKEIDTVPYIGLDFDEAAEENEDIRRLRKEYILAYTAHVDDLRHLEDVIFDETLPDAEVKKARERVLMLEGEFKKKWGDFFKAEHKRKQSEKAYLIR